MRTSHEEQLERTWKALGGWDAPLTLDDIRDFESGVLRVLAFMADQNWHHPEDIRRVAGAGRTSSEGLRRMRQLRKLPNVRIDKHREDGTRTWHYRLVFTREEQQAQLPLWGGEDGHDHGLF